VFRTLVGLFLASVLVRLTLIVVVPDALQDYESAYGSSGPVIEQWIQGDD
jgi:hypothetical protein